MNMTLKKVDNKLTLLKRGKNYDKKYRIIDDLYDILSKSTIRIKNSNELDVRELVAITKSLETVMKAEYLLDSEMQVVNSNEVQFDFE